MRHIGGTEMVQGNALVLIIHIFATCFKGPLEAHEAKEEETNGRRSDAIKKGVI